MGIYIYGFPIGFMDDLWDVCYIPMNRSKKIFLLGGSSHES